MDKLIYAKRQMAKIPVMYEQLMRMHPDGMPSLGMVARWDRVGGFTGGFSSMVETAAMKNLTISDAQQTMLKWLDAVYEVYFRLIDPEGKNSVKLQHDRKLGVVLKERVFEGKNYENIRDIHFLQQVSTQYVQRLYDEVVELVADEAERRGLLKTSA